MRQVHCDGCGMNEPQDLPKLKKTIYPVRLLVVKDPFIPSGTQKYEADLCPNCVGIVLHQYFKMPAKGQLELPAFIDPRARKV